MKVYVDADEWYPVYGWTGPAAAWRDEIEVDEATLKRWNEAHDAFIAVQDEVEAMVKAAKRPVTAQ